MVMVGSEGACVPFFHGEFASRDCSGIGRTLFPMEGLTVTTDTYYLEYQTSDNTHLFLSFQNENDRDGCHISLDMYKSQLGTVDMAVLHGILIKFQGRIIEMNQSE